MLYKAKDDLHAEPWRPLRAAERVASVTAPPPQLYNRGQPEFDIRGELVEDTMNAVRRAGFDLELDATERRLLPPVKDGPEDNMAILLSHVPPKFPFGI